MGLHKIYHPITASPFLSSESYREYEPCESLRPYIRCFWGATGAIAETLVVPDTCMDIIFKVDYTDNRITSRFCGISDCSVIAEAEQKNGKEISTFAIRFYAWSACLFSEESMRDTKNGFFELDYHFAKLRGELEPLLFEVVGMEDRIAIVQKYLLRRLRLERWNPSVINAVSEILLKRGNVGIRDISSNIAVGNRQLQRLFKENMGISPKQFSEMIRYQCLWNDIVYQPDFHIQDAVYQYGYADQAHLLHEFKRFHSMTIPQARRYAYRNIYEIYKNVAFLQERLE